MLTIDKLNQELSKDLLNFNSPKARIVDQVSHEEIGSHLDHYAQHMAAKGYKIGVREIIDYLYSSKALSENECFVTIDRCIELINEGQMLPIIIMEVLNYAKELEDASMKLVRNNLESEDFYINNLKKVLNKRFKNYKKESVNE